ncbi:sugar ABC transporter permease [Paenibacillus polysaccharolyticus]|uniref:Carbohydrate ABC transporter membrane protein 1, CUT1 family n=2 Tax=Paenibacillus TaxID=44249 RepID=A0A1G5L8Q4_9BACL|nr:MULTISPECIES: sugar ABC transporter permease [Paenibacillus]MDP9698651.1 raffinose/stachyose/melibiose transport system permease protein [Paenibacillus intestini]MBY0201913.1 sugar ABC transporter permease [Paenibacillus cucumis (ex Kampfer et al. 2016)]MCP1134768.1 sugar ABC transporter permease [Paenibacillus polysaccharolyticus]MDT0122123.1 sugar ABC transporter permease [Paenibacillus sp. RRE4]SCZ09333.1 carbohydrate ABC transporter membrane protein 1, CUT1 family [Paenibacillus polysac
MDRKIRMRNAGTFLLFGAPSVVAFLAVVVIPFIVGLYLTFTNWDVRTGDNTFIGISNYIAVWQDTVFWTQLWFTLKYVFFTVIIANAAAFFIALVLTGGGRGEQWLRTGFFTPNLIGGIILGYLWQTLFSQVLPYLGQKYGWSWFETSWLTNTDTAFWALVITTSWQLIGYLMIIYIAGFAGVPNDVLEAASIDGASRMATIRRIMLPLTIPAIVICVFISISRSFLTYDINLALTKGGPFNSTELATYHIVQKAFLSNQYGVGQAEAVVLFAVVAIIALTQSYLLKRLEVES